MWVILDLFMSQEKFNAVKTTSKNGTHLYVSALGYVSTEVTLSEGGAVGGGVPGGGV